MRVGYLRVELVKGAVEERRFVTVTGQVVYVYWPNTLTKGPQSVVTIRDDIWWKGGREGGREGGRGGRGGREGGREGGEEGERGREGGREGREACKYKI